MPSTRRVANGWRRSNMSRPGRPMRVPLSCGSSSSTLAVRSVFRTPRRSRELKRSGSGLVRVDGALVGRLRTLPKSSFREARPLSRTPRSSLMIGMLLSVGSCRASTATGWFVAMGPRGGSSWSARLRSRPGGCLTQPTTRRSRGGPETQSRSPRWSSRKTTPLLRGSRRFRFGTPRTSVLQTRTTWRRRSSLFGGRAP